MYHFILIPIILISNLLPSVDFRGEVNVYSHRHYATDKQLFKLFTEKTGIKVNVVKADADQLIKRLEIEGSNSPADVLITVDAGRLYRAKEKGLLQPIVSEVLNQSIPSHLRDPAGHWFGLTTRARVIVYSKKRVDPSELDTYEDLTSAKWKGRVLVRSSHNIYNESLLASIVASEGADIARKWAKGMVQNFARKPKGNDRDQMKAIAARIGDVAIVNTYYVGLMLNSDSENERKVARELGIFFPNQKGRGTHINVSGAGVTAHAKNKESAIKFIEFLSSKEAQQTFAKANYEYPVNPDVQIPSLLQSWGTFKAEKINLSLLGRYNRVAVKIFDEVGWN